MYKKVEPWYEITDMLHSKMNFICEMSRNDHGFLCSLIRETNPKKIVEIGVAEGGTTAVVEMCLQSLSDEKREFYSVDLNANFYHDSSKETGYEYWNIKNKINLNNNIEHTFMFGQCIAGQIEKIGNEIDMVILDTTHCFPGEVLDLLCILPFIKTGGIIVLHDVNFNYYKSFSSDPRMAMISKSRIATKMLMVCTSGEKYINSCNGSFENIGAIKISDETRKNIEELFMLLSVTWEYSLDDKMCNQYKKIYSKFYNQKCLEIFDISVKQNKEIKENMNLLTLKSKLKKIEVSIPYNLISKNSKIIIYGANDIGCQLKFLFESSKYCKVEGWVDACENVTFNDIMKDECAFNSLNFDYVIVAAHNNDEYISIKNRLIVNGWAKEEQIICSANRKSICDMSCVPTRNKWLIPYEKLPYGKKICIFGAGMVGREVYAAITATEYCEITAWVDNNYKHIKDEAVSAPNALMTAVYDYIIIAVNDEKVFAEIKKQLHNEFNIKDITIIGPISIQC